MVSSANRNMEKDIYVGEYWKDVKWIEPAQDAEK